MASNLRYSVSGQIYSELELEVWDYIMTHKKNFIKKGAQSISWVNFEKEWKRTATIAYLLDNRNVVPLRTALQLK